MATVPKKVLIIGYGNPLRGDDGLGWRAAELLATAPEEGAAAPAVIACHQLTPELASEISQADRVIFIDASCDNGPGQLVCRLLAADCPPNSPSSHHLDPLTLLGCAEKLYGRRPEALLFSVGGACFAYREGLSPAVEGVMPDLLARVRQACAAPSQALIHATENR